MQTWRCARSGCGKVQTAELRARQHGMNYARKGATGLDAVSWLTRTGLLSDQRTAPAAMGQDEGGPWRDRSIAPYRRAEPTRGPVSARSQQLQRRRNMT